MEDEIFEKDVITLLDEQNIEHEFEIIQAAEYNDNSYLALVPIYDDAQEVLDDSGELVILRVGSGLDSDEDSFLEAIEDDNEYDAVAKIFMDMLEEEYDFEDEDDDEDDVISPELIAALTSDLDKADNE